MEVGCRSASFPLKGMGTVKSCLDKGYRPCPECCTETWLDKLRDYNRAKIAKRDSRYFFFSHSPIFHRGTCDCILTSTQGYHGRESYEECVRLGCIPCELCKPEAEETVEVKAEERVEEKAEENAEAAKANKVDYSWMTPKEKRALERYEEAVRLQDSVDMRKLSKQQRRDMLVLNATDCAFWAAAGYRSFHLRHCRRMDKLSNFKGFYTYQQAVYAGYQPCRECRPSAKQDVSIYMTLDTRRIKGERLENVLALCSRLQLSYTYEEPFISMSTEQGEWKINVLRNPVIPEHKPEGEQTFHRQHRMFLSMSDAVRYIAKHDCVQSQSLESKIMKSRRRSKK
jgi:methylphosphotriester-DNA--protein-cysteine methyltransferase